MPYTPSQLAKDRRFRKLSAHAREIFAHVFNSANASGRPESYCFAAAWAAAKRRRRKK